MKGRRFSPTGFIRHARRTTDKSLFVRPRTPGGMQLRQRSRGSQGERGRPDEKGDRVMNLDAKPEAIMFVTAKTAVLVVDMQNDFGSKGGMFDRAGLDISMIQATLYPTSKVLAAARNARIPI